MGYTRSQAIKLLFGKKLSEYEFFKSRLTGFEDSKTIKIDHLAKRSGEGGRGKRVYHADHLNLLFNVIIISAFFGKPSIVSEIVSSLKNRRRHFYDIKRLLNSRLTVGSINFEPDKLAALFDFMDSDQSLSEEKIPNPFTQLPQFLVNGKERYISVYEAYKASSTEKTKVEHMLLAYFDMDIEQAFQLARQLGDLQGYDSQVQNRILKEYDDAVKFEDLLGDFRN